MSSTGATQVILIHGFGSSFEHGWRQSGWVDILGDFGAEAPPVDLPGHGSSPHTTDPADYADVPEALFASLPAAPPYRAVGFSIGAQQILRMAIAHPDAFERIVLLGLGDSVFESDPATLIIEALSSEQEPEDVSLRVFRRLAETTGSDVPSLVAFLERPRPALTEELLAKVSCPVLLVLGERDAPAPTRLLASLPDAELVMLPGVDHFSTPQDFGAIDATMRFLGLD